MNYGNYVMRRSGGDFAPFAFRLFYRIFFLSPFALQDVTLNEARRRSEVVEHADIKYASHKIPNGTDSQIKHDTIRAMFDDGLGAA